MPGVLLLPLLLLSAGLDVRVGEAVDGAWTGDPVAFVLIVEEGGPLTIDVESWDFDPRCVVTRPAFDSVAVEDGGIADNARLIIDARAGERIEVIVAGAGDGGSFTLRTTRGRLAAAGARPHAIASARWLARSALRCRERGDHDGAAQTCARAAGLLRDFEVAEEEIALWRQVVLLADEADLVDRAASARIALALALLRAGREGHAGEAIAVLAPLHMPTDDRWLEVGGAALGSALRKTGQGAAAADVLGRALALSREQDGEHQGEILEQLALLRAQQGDLGAAVDLLTERAQVCLQRADASGAGLALHRLGSVHKAESRMAEAIDAYTQALRQFEACGDRRRVGHANESLGSALQMTGDLDGAATGYRAALAEYRAIGRGDLVGRAGQQLAQILFRQGQSTEAMELARGSIDIARADGSPADECAALLLLGKIVLVAGDHEQAVELLDAADALSARIGDMELRVEALHGLAMIARQRSDHAESRDLLERALAITEATGDIANEFLTRRFLTDVADSLGDYQASLRLAEDNARLAARMTPRYQAQALAVLAASWQHLCRYAEAQDAYERCLVIARDQSDPDLERGVLYQLGMLLGDVGDHDAAADRLRQALDMYEDHEPTWIPVQVALAHIDHRAGRIDAARTGLDRAIDGTRRLGGEPDDLPELIGLRAQFEVAGGDAEQGRALAREATALARRLQSPRVLVRALQRLAEAELVNGDIHACRVAAGEARRLALEMDAEALLQIDILLAEAALAAGGFDEIEEILDRAEVRLGARTAAGRDLDHSVGIRSRFSMLPRLRQEVIQHHVAGAADAAERSRHVDAGFIMAQRWKGSALLEGLRDREDNSPAAAPIDTAAIRANLCAADRVVVEYVDGVDALYAYVLTVDGLELLRLGDLAEIDALVRDFLACVADRDTPGDVATVVARGRALYERILEPVLRHIGSGVTDLTVSPSSTLAALSFDALVVEAPVDAARFGDVTFLIDRRIVHYAPSAAVASGLVLRPAARGDRLLLFADPDYAAAMPPIPRSRDEARVLQALIEDAPDGVRAVDAFLGADATRAPLAGDLGAYRILHFAAHGVVRLDSPRNSGVLLASGHGPDLVNVEQVLDLHLDADLVVLSACSTARGRERKGEGVESLARAFLRAGARSVVASLWEVTDAAALETMSHFYTALLREHHEPSRALREARLALRGGSGDGVTQRGVGKPRALDARTRVSHDHPFYWAPFICIGALPREQAR